MAVQSIESDHWKCNPFPPVAHGHVPPLQGNWMTLAEAEDGLCETSRMTARWVRDFLMKPHPELGRSGHVCPYMAQAARNELARISVSDLTAADKGDILRFVKDAGILFDGIDCVPAKKQFRTAMIAFPACNDEAGTRTLRDVQHGLRYHAVFRRRMVGMFEPNSQEPGVSNRAFFSFRSPVPILAVRSLVELDAPFVLRNPLMIPVYLKAFGASGRARIIAEAKRKLQSRLATAMH